MMSGSWAICIANRYGLIFCVTTAMTSSCTHADSKKVVNAAWNLDSLYSLRVELYTCRSRNVCTGTFHLRENSSNDVLFHPFDKTCELWLSKRFKRLCVSLTVLVELAVRETRDLGKAVADALEDDVKDEEVVDHHGYCELEECA